MLPFLKKDKLGSYLILSQALYPQKAMDSLLEVYSDMFSLSAKGSSFMLRVKKGSEQECLDALNYCLYAVRNAG
jgi:hypothetical protein